MKKLLPKTFWRVVILALIIGAAAVFYYQIDSGKWSGSIEIQANPSQLVVTTLATTNGPMHIIDFDAVRRSIAQNPPTGLSQANNAKINSLAQTTIDIGPSQKDEVSCIRNLDGQTFSKSFTVCPGTYNLRYGFVVNGPATVDGSGAKIIGPGSQFPRNAAILVASNNVTLTNFNIASWFYGIYASDSPTNSKCCNNIEISKNILSNNTYGIYIAPALNSIIKNNTITTSNLANGVFGIVISSGFQNPVKSLVISKNTITSGSANSFALAIGVGGSNNPSRPAQNVVIKDNILYYNGCKTTYFFCFGEGVLTQNTFSSQINNNTLDGFGAAPAIQFDGRNNMITGNTIKNFWGKSVGLGAAFYSAGITNYSYKQNNTISGNTAVADSILNKYTIGYSNAGDKNFPSLGGNQISKNKFIGFAIGYNGGVVSNQSVADILQMNNFIKNKISIEEDPKTAFKIIAVKNYYSDDIACADENSDLICDSSYTWHNNLNQDPLPHAVQYK